MSISNQSRSVLNNIARQLNNQKNAAAKKKTEQNNALSNAVKQVNNTRSLYYKSDKYAEDVKKAGGNTAFSTIQSGNAWNPQANQFTFGKTTSSDNTGAGYLSVTKASETAAAKTPEYQAASSALADLGYTPEESRDFLLYNKSDKYNPETNTTVGIDVRNQYVYDTYSRLYSEKRAEQQSDMYENTSAGSKTKTNSSKSHRYSGLSNANTETDTTNTNASKDQRLGAFAMTYPDQAENAKRALELGNKKAQANATLLQEKDDINATQYTKTATSDADFETVYKAGRVNTNNKAMQARNGEYEGTQKIYGQSPDFFKNMTEDQFNIYCYYWQKEQNGEIPSGSALNYLKSIQNRVNYSKAQEIVDSANHPVLRELYGLYAGADNFVEGLSALPEMLDNEYVPRANAVQMASQQIRADQDGFSGLTYDLFNTTGNMLPSLLLGGMSGTSWLGTTLMGASAGGNTYSELISQGVDPSTARATAIASGAWEGLSEYYLGALEGAGANRLSKSVAINALENTNKVWKNVAYRLGKAGVDMAQEGAEEIIQDLGESVINGVFQGKWEWSSVEDLLYEGLLGALSAGVLNAPTASVDIYKTSKNININNKISNLGENSAKAFDNFSNNTQSTTHAGEPSASATKEWLQLNNKGVEDANNNTESKADDYLNIYAENDGLKYLSKAQAYAAYSSGYNDAVAVANSNTASNSTENATDVSNTITNSKITPKSVKSQNTNANGTITHDSDGTKLTNTQKNYFKDSKVTDNNGNLKVVYHGTNEDFDTFDKSRSKGSNLFGRGFYFTDSESTASAYGDAKSYYLNIKNPLSTESNQITKDQLAKFVEAVSENEDYGLDNYGRNATVDSVVDSVYGKDDFSMIQDINATAIGDLVAATELFNEINGTNYDGFILPSETIAFYPNQIKEIGNANPTENDSVKKSVAKTTTSKTTETQKKSTSKSDAEYLSLAENPEQNADKLQAMVEQAAAQAMPNTKVVGKDGKPKIVYHGTISKNDFNVFNGDIYFFSKEQYADQYTHKRGGLWASPNQVGKVMPCFVNIENPLIIDAKRHLWRNIDVEWSSKPVTTEDIVKYAKENGHDGAIIKRVRDNMSDSDTGYCDEYVAFDSSQVKSAGTTYEIKTRETYPFEDYKSISNETGITYDDNGNVIPLSERFKIDNEDIRYAKTDSTTTDNNTQKSNKYWRHRQKAEWQTTRTANNTAEIRTVNEIMTDMAHNFGLNHTVGNMRKSPSAMATYTLSDKNIKTRIDNDLADYCHELGHALDHRYEITFAHDGRNIQLPSEIVGELMKCYHEKFTDKQYDADERVSEGFAEYLRQYLKNSDETIRKYPETTKLFLNSISYEDGQLIDLYADQINAYMSAEVLERRINTASMDAKSYDPRSKGEKIKDFFQRTYTAMVDDKHPIKKFSEIYGDESYTYALNTPFSNSVAEQMILGQHLTNIDGEVVGAGFRTCFDVEGFDLTDKKTYQDFNDYLVAKHAPERLNDGLAVYADPVMDDINAFIETAEKLESENPTFKDVAERLYDYIEKFERTWLVETGLMEEKMFDKWEDKWKYYVPLQRVVPNNGIYRGKSNRSMVDQKSPMKKAKGSEHQIIKPVESFMSNMVKIISSARANQVMQIMSDTAIKAKQTNDFDARFMEKLDEPIKMTKLKGDQVTKNITSDLKKHGVDIEDIEVVEEYLDRVTDFGYQVEKSKTNPDKMQVTIMKNGKPEFWKINDVDLYKSLANLNSPKIDGILAAYGVTTKYMTSFITGLNPKFAIASNAPRDLGTAITYWSDKKKLGKLVKGIGSAYFNSFKNTTVGEKIVSRSNRAMTYDPIYSLYLAMGQGNSSMVSSDIDMAKRARKKMAGKVTFSPIGMITTLNDTVEAGPRYAAFKQAIENGESPQRAVIAAQEITTNFSRGGYLSRQINMAIPFFNAQVQGVDRFVRWLTAADFDGTQKANTRKGLATKRITGLITASAILAAITSAINLLGDDEEEFEKLSAYTKNNYFVFMVDGKAVCIPKPREIAILTSLFERSAEATIGENDNAFYDFYGYAVENMLPALLQDVAQIPTDGIDEARRTALGSLGIIGVMSYLASNKDFLGRPIVSEALENETVPSTEYDDTTSKLAYYLGQALNLSPKRIDFFFGQTLGGFWSWQKSMFPVDQSKADYSIGIASNYVKDPNQSTDIANMLYDQNQRSKDLYAADGTITNKVAATMDSTMSTFYSKINKLIKEENSSSNDGIKSSVLNMVLSYLETSNGGSDAANSVAYNRVKQIVIKANDPDTASKALPGTMATEIKDENDKKITLTAKQYYEYQETYLNTYYSLVSKYIKSSNKNSVNYELLKTINESAKDYAKATAVKSAGGKTSVTTTVTSTKGTTSKTTYLNDYVRFSNAGCDVNAYVEYQNNLLKYDRASSTTGTVGTYSISEKAKAISALNISDSKKAQLYNLITGATTTYDTALKNYDNGKY